MASSILLTFLTAVILGADVTISDTEQIVVRTTSENLETTTITPFSTEKDSTIREKSNLNSTTTTATNLQPTTTTTLTSVRAEARFQNESFVNDITTTTATMTIPATATTQLVTITTSSQLIDLTATATATTTATTTATATTKTTKVLSSIAAPPSSDSLTKGFSIPTFLPARPSLSAAIGSSGASLLPHPKPTTTSLPTEQQQQQQEQVYLAAFNSRNHHASKHNRTTQKTNVTVQLGSHAYLPCHIRRLMNKPISWVRVRDGHILTVDQTTFIADQRFQSIFKGENEYTWSLQIKYVQSSDEGWYECQVSTEPKMSARVFLDVVVPRTELIGDQNRFVKAGSKVALHCIVRGTLEAPSYIIWFRGKTQIMDDNQLGWYTQIDRNIFGNSSDQQNTIGSLIIPFVRKKDSGNYVCQPSNSAPVSVDLHVLSGEYSASAIMSVAVTTHKKHNICYLFLIFLPTTLART